MVATVFPMFDIPVFWPILLVYFLVLFFITMRRQIGHMRKYKCVGSWRDEAVRLTCSAPCRYLPWDWGKSSYRG